MLYVSRTLSWTDRSMKTTAGLASVTALSVVEGELACADATPGVSNASGGTNRRVRSGRASVDLRMIQAPFQARERLPASFFPQV